MEKYVHSSASILLLMALIAVVPISQAGEEREEIVTITLKNSGVVRGIIEQEDEKGLLVDVGYGMVGISKDQIDTIARPEGAERDEELRAWEREKKLIKESRNKKKFEHSIYFADSSRIIVDAVLNNKLNVKLLVDTGATSVFISRQTASKLSGAKIDPAKKVAVKSGGSTMEGMALMLESVKVAGAEAKNVEAVMLEKDKLNMFPGVDGLLGMSFLNRFHLKIDSENRRMILREKYRGL